MKSYNPENERVKRQYFTYLKEARRNSEASLDTVAKALNRFEQYGKCRSFKRFHFQQAIAFKKHLANQAAIRSGERLNKATQYGTLRALRDFFHWLADKPGYRSRLSFADAEYFNLSEKETRIAKAEREQPVPTLEQIKHVIQAMPASTDIERRDRALIAFTILTGARDGAIASLKLKHVDLTEGLVRQDAREVRTKFSKTFTTWFFPVGKEFSQIVDHWVAHLQKDRLWGPSDPLFPATEIALGPGQRFRVSGLRRAHWTRAQFGGSSRMPSRRQVCRTSTRTVSERRWPCLGGTFVHRLNSSRPGAKISGMRVF